MSLGFPVVASRSKIEQFFFDDSVMHVLDFGDPSALVEAMREVLGNMNLRLRKIASASEYSSAMAGTSAKLFSYAWWIDFNQLSTVSGGAGAVVIAPAGGGRRWFSMRLQ